MWTSRGTRPSAMVGVSQIPKRWETRTEMNGQDLPVEAGSGEWDVFGTDVRPYVPYVVTFTAGILFGAIGAIGASYLGADDPTRS